MTPHSPIYHVGLKSKRNRLRQRSSPSNARDDVLDNPKAHHADTDLAIEVKVTPHLLDQRSATFARVISI